MATATVKARMIKVMMTVLFGIFLTLAFVFATPGAY
jgi:hypothetical protein